jgi:mono/diheme cytochrome c family protein
MPVFPFDNTKFLALTHMLDVLGRKNTDELHTEWSLQGFNPEEAYQNLCSQCHGPYLQGDGPVSLWIYPIPKNLRNSVFMINYTKERVINSITNGVQGTPMPPWGEVARGKQGEHATPVLNKEQIQILSDWLFEGLGANNIQPESEIMKWEYTPEDFIKELKRIPLDNFKDEKTPKQGAMLQLYPRGDQYLAAIEPMPVKGNNLTVEDIFDVVPYKDSTVDKKAYYIKKIYYTPENLAAGEALFNLNCAVCHGKEGDGSGNRAGSMTDAKPRMLTNLNWLETRDDLRLLRSIKYGVPGTSMIAWGDFTNALQRMQLVMYIRSLTEDPLKNDQLQQAIYQAFFENQETLEQARTLVHEKLDKYQSDYDKHQIARTEKSLHVDMTEGEVFKEYQIESTLRSHVQSYSDIDDSLLNLIDINKKEQQMYYMLGNRIITTLPEDKLFTDYLKMIALNENRFSLKDNVLTVNVLDVKKFNQLFDSIHLQVKKKMSDLIAQKEKMVKESTSSETPKELSELSSQISAVEKIKDDLIALDGQTKRQLAQEKQIVDQFNIQMKELGKKE